MKFSDLLGEPEPDPEAEAALPVTDRETEVEPISVFAPVPVSPPPAPRTDVTTELPAPPPPPLPGGRSGLAELNVRQAVPDATPTVESSLVDQLTGLDEIVDDLLPSRRNRR